jgi:hypothetical protein
MDIAVDDDRNGQLCRWFLAAASPQRLAILPSDVGGAAGVDLDLKASSLQLNISIKAAGVVAPSRGKH